MPLPERQVNAILQKFGPEILRLLKANGFDELEGPYDPSEMQLRIRSSPAWKRYQTASKLKNREVWQVVEKFLLPELEGTGEAFIAAYGLKPVINVEDISLRYMRVHSGELIKQMTQTDKKKLMDFVWSNSSKNERVLARQILKDPNLSTIVDNSRNRTRTIIRTERQRAIRGGAQGFANSAGATTKTWRTVGDSRVRKTHRALNGTTVKINEDFGIEGGYPGATAVNCRCYLLYGFDKEIADHPHPSDETLSRLYDVTPSEESAPAPKAAPKKESSTAPTQPVELTIKGNPRKAGERIP